MKKNIRSQIGRFSFFFTALLLVNALLENRAVAADTINICSKDEPDLFIKSVVTTDHVEFKACRFSKSDSYCQILGKFSKQALAQAQFEQQAATLGFQFRNTTGDVGYQYLLFQGAKLLATVDDGPAYALLMVGEIAWGFSKYYFSGERSDKHKALKRSEAIATVSKLSTHGKARECNYFDGNVSSLTKDLTDGLVWTDRTYQKSASTAPMTSEIPGKLNRSPAVLKDTSGSAHSAENRTWFNRGGGY